MRTVGPILGLFELIWMHFCMLNINMVLMTISVETKNESFHPIFCAWHLGRVKGVLTDFWQFSHFIYAVHCTLWYNPLFYRIRYKFLLFLFSNLKKNAAFLSKNIENLSLWKKIFFPIQRDNDSFLTAQLACQRSSL